MTEIYHNPRCSKSRQCLHLIENSNHEFSVINYLEDTISKEKLNEIIVLLGIKPIDLIRKQESIWKEQYKGKKLSDQEVIQAMIDYPKLMERPIVIHKNKAIIGRPPEKVLDIL